MELVIALVIPFGLFLVVQAFLQYTEHKQQRRLSSAERDRLLDGTSDHHSRRMLPITVLGIALGVIIWRDPATEVLWGAFTLFLVFSVISLLYSERAMLRKLRSLALPAEYLRHSKRRSRIQTALTPLFLGWLFIAAWMLLQDPGG